MRRWVVGVVLATAAVTTAYGQSGDWAAVQTIKFKSTLIVESGGNYTRCRLVAIDANALTCQDPGWHHPRVVYPMAQVESVYHVHTRWATPRTVFSIAVVVCLVAGAAASNAGIFLLGAVGGAIGGMIALAHDTGDLLTGRPPQGPFRTDERQDLIYVRSAS